MEKKKCFKPPIGSFLDKYIQYGNELTDAPSEFHLMFGLSLLSSVCHGFCLNDNPSDRFNLWSLIVGPSAISRKSTALHIANDILQRVNVGLLGPNDFSGEGLWTFFNVCPEKDKKKKMTPDELIAEQYLVQSMTDERKPGALFFSEFGGMMKNFQKDYNAGLKQFLADLYDNSGFKKRQLSNGKLAIINPYLTVAAASSSDWFEKSISAGDIGGGFLNRFIYFIDYGRSDTDWKSPLERRSKDVKKRQELIDHLKSLDQMKGNHSIIFNEEAKLMFNTWAKELDDLFKLFIQNENEGQKSNPLFARKTLQALKISCLLALSREVSLGSALQAPEVTLEDVNQAIDCVEFFDTASKSYLQSLVKPTTVNSISERLEFVIKNRGTEWIDRTTLCKKAKLTSLQLQHELQALIDDGVIVSSMIPSEGRPIKKYLHKDFYAK